MLNGTVESRSARYGFDSERPELTGLRWRTVAAPDGGVRFRGRIAGGPVPLGR